MANAKNVRQDGECSRCVPGTAKVPLLAGAEQKTRRLVKDGVRSNEA